MSFAMTRIPVYRRRPDARGRYLPKEPYFYGGHNQRTARQAAGSFMKEHKLEVKAMKADPRARKHDWYSLLDKLRMDRNISERRLKKAWKRFEAKQEPRGRVERAYESAICYELFCKADDRLYRSML